MGNFTLAGPLLGPGGNCMIPERPGPGDIPASPERPEPLRGLPPVGAVWEELEETHRKLRDLADRLSSVEERLSKLEGHRHG